MTVDPTITGSKKLKKTLLSVSIRCGIGSGMKQEAAVFLVIWMPTTQ